MCAGPAFKNTLVDKRPFPHSFFFASTTEPCNVTYTHTHTHTHTRTHAHTRTHTHAEVVSYLYIYDLNLAGTSIVQVTETFTIRVHAQHGPARRAEIPCPSFGKFAI